MPASAPSSSGAPPAAFPQTRWSVVLAAARTPSLESADALETLCRAYWPPLYAYARRCGQSPHDAQDLTQEFFRLLLEKRWLADADREQGRLRSFLITALRHFMAKEWRRTSAQKRGGGQALVAFDTALAEQWHAAEPAAGLSPDAVFDRQWALTLLDLTLKRLEGEFAIAGKAADFAVLKGCLTTAHGTLDYAKVAEQLGIQGGAARVAVHRLRKRFREIYRDELAQTLTAGEAVEDELRHLAAALATEVEGADVSRL
jgi:RNA polymerase sigma factor (sigma-70 family)